MAAKSILVTIQAVDSEYRLTVDTGQPGEVEPDSPFEFSGSGRIDEVIHGIEAGHCKLDNLRDVGSELYDSVFCGKKSKLLESVRSSNEEGEIGLLRLRLPRDLEQLPWESLYNDQSCGFLCTHPNYCIVREPYSSGDQSPNLRENQIPLKLLAIVPKGSGLNAEQELHNLEEVRETYPGSFELGRLDGRVTPERLGKTLAERKYDIVHFIGHGEVTGNDRFSIRLNDPRDGEDFWMDGEIFASLFYRHPPRLVVLNCCLGAAASPSRTMTGIAPALLRSGVLAVVAMRYEIADEVAAQFTSSFYRELMGGGKSGRVDSAVCCARQLIFQNMTDGTVRGFVTPVLYLKYGSEQLFQMGDAQEPKLSEPLIVIEEIQVPHALQLCLDKLRLRDCVVVAGPSVANATSVIRSERRAPTIYELAERLAVECHYPWSSEFGTGQNTRDWLSGLLLPLVCQQYQRAKKRYELISAIQDAYKGVEPPPVFRSLARLGSPGIVYTHFDGLFEKAFAERNLPVHALQAVDQPFDAVSEGTVLICAKGTLRLQTSLVLTVEDHENLYDRMARIAPVLRARMQGNGGRSTLFLGVSPRDELVRRIAAQMLEAGDTRTQGPTFFITEYQSPGDDAYWQKYDVRWIDYAVDKFANLLQREIQ